jgi:hypothetical protein
VEVILPGGTRIRASSIRDRRPDDADRTFGLYMDAAWRPTWPAEVIDWQDFGVPADGERAARQIEDAYARAAAGELVEVGCLGGLGRTGTVLACMAVLAGVPGEDAVPWVRRAYDVRAVETEEQAEWVRWFARRTAAAREATGGRPAE